MTEINDSTRWEDLTPGEQAEAKQLHEDERRREEEKRRAESKAREAAAEATREFRQAKADAGKPPEQLAEEAKKRRAAKLASLARRRRQTEEFAEQERKQRAERKAAQDRREAKITEDWAWIHEQYSELSPDQKRMAVQFAAAAMTGAALDARDMAWELIGRRAWFLALDSVPVDLSQQG